MTAFVKKISHTSKTCQQAPQKDLETKIGNKSQNVTKIANNAKSQNVTKIKNVGPIACWVGTTTSQAKYANRLKAMKDTWGPRCDKLFIFHSTKDLNRALPDKRDKRWRGEYFVEGDDIYIPGFNETWLRLLVKTVHAFKYISTYHMEKFDWFLKADDDTYVVMENLKRFLSEYSPNEIHYFGCEINMGTWFNSGGAGYVLSREALKRLYEKEFSQMKLAATAVRHDFEDVAVGKMLRKINKEADKTVDNKLRHRWLALHLEHAIYRPSMPYAYGWFPNNARYPVPEGGTCCSPTLVSFHFVSPGNMRALDFMLYHVAPKVIEYQKEHQQEKGQLGS